jgi:DNA/RNA endonuclease G (NUC1)
MYTRRAVILLLALTGCGAGGGGGKGGGEEGGGGNGGGAPVARTVPAPASPDTAPGARIVITEIMANPGRVSDARGEWFELYNPGDRPVDLKGWTLRSNGDSPQSITASLPVPPRGYVVLANDGDASTNGGVTVAYAYGGALSLNNGTTDALWIADAGGATMDSVVWGTSSPPSGRSRALTDPALDNLAMSGPGSHWITSSRTFGAGDRGTPGAPNDGAPTGGAPAAGSDTTTRTTAPAAAIYRNHLEFGVPTDGTPTDDYRMDRRQYSLSYNAKRGGPNWVSWNLNRTHFGDAPRCDCFAVDTLLPRRMTRIASSDYIGSGYSRGHMVMSEERTATEADNAATFLMTNILPQRQELNGGPWGRLEAYTNDLAGKENRELYIIAGGTYDSVPATLNGAGRVAIPATTWKIVVVMKAGEGLADVHHASDLRVIAVDMPNVTGIASHDWTRYRTTVDAIEAATGYDFLDLLPDSIEEAVERER